MRKTRTGRSAHTNTHTQAHTSRHTRDRASTLVNSYATNDAHNKTSPTRCESTPSELGDMQHFSRCKHNVIHVMSC